MPQLSVQGRIHSVPRTTAILTDHGHELWNLSDYEYGNIVMMNMGGESFFMGFGGLFMWLVWILLAVVLFGLIKGLFNTGTRERPPALPQSPLEVLRDRFARGEIDEEEFRMRSELLKKTEE